jgi:subfamily B ATP-binding cassette protein MsbA
MPVKELLRLQARIVGYIRPYWKVVVAALVFTVFVAVARLSQAKFVNWLFALMTKETFAYSGGRDPFMQLNGIIGGFLVLLALMGIGSFCQRYFVDLSGQSAVRDLREGVFKHLQRLDLTFFDSMRLGEIQSRATADIVTATSIYTVLADFLKNLLIVLVAFAWMFYTDFKMTLLVLMLSPLIGIAVGRFGQKMGHITESLQARMADLSSIMFENVSSQKVIKGYHRESFEIERFSKTNEENFRTQMKLVQIAATQTPVVEVLAALGIITIVYFGATRVLQGAATFGQMTEYWTLMVMTTQPISALSGFYSSMQSSAAAGKRVFAILDTEPAIKDGEGSLVLPPVKGQVEFRDVHFAYEAGVPVLQGISLTVQAGEVVAIVGPNGAGKTSFVNLLPRFYDPTAGSIHIDGHDLREVTVGSLRTQIGTVIQESVLFGASIAENIACGRADFSREQIVEAARVANADEFIRRLPEGYDTQVGERGLRLSGGQRQRIAIARALLRDPKILILDEFTSGIDTESENLITEAIERIMRGRTSLVIAHRLNTIRHADRIVVIEAGRVVETGSHEKLLARNGLYAKLYEAQLRTPIVSETERKGA